MQGTIELKWERHGDQEWAAHDRALDVWVIIRRENAGPFEITYNTNGEHEVGTEHATLDAAMQQAATALFDKSLEEAEMHGHVDRDEEAVAGDEGGE